MRSPKSAVIWRSLERIPIHLILLIAFLSLVVLVNAEWLAIDHRPPRWDEFENLQLAQIAYQRLINFDWGNLLVSNGTARPNFIPVLSALSFPIVGRNIDTTVFVLSSASLLVTSVCLYDTGRRLLNQSAGLLAVVLYNTMPGILLFSRYYHMDIPLGAFVTATIWLALVYVEEPAWRAWLAPSLGVIVAMGMSAKHLYPIYVALPLAWMLVVLWPRSDWRLLPFLRQHAGVIAALVIGIMLGLGYLLVLNYQGFVDGVLRSFFIDKSPLAAIGYVQPTVLQRLQGIEQFEFGGKRWLSVLLLFGGLCALASSFRRLAFVWLSLLGADGFLIFILGPTDVTYFIATMPVTALLMSTFVILPSRLSDLQTVRVAVVVLAVIVGGISVRTYLKSSLDTASPLAVVLAAPTILLSSKSIDTNPIADSSYWNKTVVLGNVDTLPYPHRWPIEDVLETIQTSAKTLHTDQLLIGLFSNFEWFNGHAFEYWMTRMGMNTRFELSLPLPPPASVSSTQLFSQFDILILKTEEIRTHGLSFRARCSGIF